jgi:hypothetical protein
MPIILVPQSVYNCHDILEKSELPVIIPTEEHQEIGTFFCGQYLTNRRRLIFCLKM